MGNGLMGHRHLPSPPTECLAEGYMAPLFPGKLSEQEEKGVCKLLEFSSTLG